MFLVSVIFVGTAWGADIPRWFNQRVDHFRNDLSTYQQRFYREDQHFGGAGIFYPSIKDVMAADPAFNAVVIEPEHRFYGASLPF
eukprot:gene29763-26449_t